MRQAAWFALLLSIAGGLAVPLGAQEVNAGQQLAARAPRFLLASTAGAASVAVDARGVTALRRRISLDLQGVTLEEALTAISRQAGLRLMYSKAVVPLESRVQLQAINITVAGALTEVLLDAQVDVLLTSDGQAVLMRRPARKAVPVQNGSVSGRVTDAKTAAPIVGATVVVEGTSLSATTDNDGRYRIAEVPAGTHTVRARYIGYAPATASVTVSADQEVTADFALEKSAQKLDELVTVTPGGMQTEARALSSPVTVITAEEIAAQRPQTINQVFRQLVPSGVGFISPRQPTVTGLSVRGSSSISGTSSIKVFIDGVEVSAAGTSPVDPGSIERIEVIRGPQAATLYGPDAAGGILQIFTKRGAGHPRIDLRAQSGVLQTPYPGSRSALRQEYNASLTGGGSDVNYTVGGSYTHLNDWMPWAAPTAQSLPSVFGGIRYARGTITVDLSSRFMRSVLPLEGNPDLQSSGLITFTRPSFDVQTWENQTASARVAVAPTPWWQNQLTIGIDRFTLDQRQTERRFTTPADSFFTVFASRSSKTSLQLNSGVTPRLSTDVTGSLIAGVDYYRADAGLDLISGALNTSGTIRTAPGAFLSLSKDAITNTGYFAQAQVGWRETLFLNGGVRADANSTFGAGLGTQVQPRVGLSAVLQSGIVTLKLRGAYGRAIRAPAFGRAQGIAQSSQIQLENLLLRPERQRGWDAGADLIFGNRGSLNATWYDQIADDLIVQVFTAASPLTFQFQNVGRVANRGLEVEGTLNLHPLQVRAQYAYTDSRIQDLGGAAGTGLTVGGRPQASPAHTGGATLTTAPWRTGNVSLGFTYVGGYRATDFLALNRCFGGTGPCPDPPLFSNFQSDYPGFAKATLNVTQRITSQVDGFLSIDNLTNNSAFEGPNILPVMGRTTMVGLHALF